MLPPMAQPWHRREEGAARESAGGEQLVTRADRARRGASGCGPVLRPSPSDPVRPARRRRQGLPGRLAPAASSPPRSLPPPPSLPGCCRALPGRRRRQTFQSGKPAPWPGPAAGTARDPSPPRAPAPPRARLDPSCARPGPRTDLAIAGVSIAVRCPCFRSLPDGPAPAPGPSGRRLAGASVRRPSRTAQY